MKFSLLVSFVLLALSSSVFAVKDLQGNLKPHLTDALLSVCVSRPGEVPLQLSLYYDDPRGNSRTSVSLNPDTDPNYNQDLNGFYFIKNGSIVHQVAGVHTGGVPRLPIYDGSGIMLTYSKELYDSGRGSAVLDRQERFTDEIPGFNAS